MNVVGPGAGTPAGSVTFKDGSTVLGTIALDGGGQAVLTTSALKLGKRTIKATYSGSTQFASSSNSRVQVVGLSLGPTVSPSVRTALGRANDAALLSLLGG
jgi:hypothetical protein